MNCDEVFNNIRELDEKIHKLEEVSGHDIDTLISLFAAGYELKPSETMVNKLAELGKAAVNHAYQTTADTGRPQERYLHPTIDLLCKTCGGTGMVSWTGVYGLVPCPVCKGSGGRKILRK